MVQGDRAGVGRFLPERKSAIIGGRGGKNLSVGLELHRDPVKRQISYGI